MTMISWPADVPFLCRLPDLRYSGPQGDRFAFAPDTGPRRTRRRTTAGYRMISGSTPVLDAAERAAFETWWEVTASGGTATFYATHPITGALAAFRATGDSFDVQPVGAGKVRIAASLWEIPTPAVLGYAVNKIAPEYVLDFVNEIYIVDHVVTTFANAVTFARSGTATMTDSTGTLVTVADGVPRIGHHVYEGGQWVNEGLLLESEARENLITYSEDFAGNWAGVNATLTLDATGPDGTTSATTLGDDGGTGTGQVRAAFNLSLATSTMHTLSIFAKADQLDWLVLWTNNFTTGDGETYFDLANGVVGTVDAGHDGGATIEKWGNGWYRCSVSFTTDAVDTNGVLYVQLADADGDKVVDRDGTSSILLFGAQLEEGATPSSYAPTDGSTVVRAAETLTGPAGTVPYSSTAMSIWADGTITYADNGDNSEAIFFNWEADGTHYIAHRLSTGGSRTGSPFFLQYAGVLDLIAGGITAYSPGINVPFSIASRHGSSFVNGAVDGVALTADETPVALPNLSATDFQIGVTFNGTFALICAAGADIADIGLAEATS